MGVLPAHIAIIPDGNRRWARARGLVPMEGHRAAYEQAFNLVEAVADRGVQYLTFYAFSTENWKRAQEEVGFLMGLLEHFILKEMNRLHAQGVRIRFFGSRAELSDTLQAGMARVEALTGSNQRIVLNLCINYGGRRDILEAVRAIVREGIAPEAVDEAVIAAHLSTRDTPPPDLIVRTSGEQRLSNYLLWEGAYAELVFVNKLWPDVNVNDIDEVLAEYARRQRRYGGD